MSSFQTKHISCILCGQERPRTACVPALSIRRSIAEFIAERHAHEWRADGCVCRSCLNTARHQQLMEQLERERGQVSAIEANVSRKAAEHVAIASHIDQQFQQRLTFGQRLADAVATVGGSWPFVAGFLCVLAAWIGLNSLVLRGEAFDPYPYILLNLALSCIAAVQAPVIMMSQNRAAARDRLEADEDYKINLKAELEVAGLHDKVDHLLRIQWEQMAEVRQTQLEILAELTRSRR